ncbi:hypothetical protein B296_00027125 [Ensete ventricosum]|uniref:Uncharacterized protein n=1 Tax=Ensete ventricosum TaxID=4639 RepID=A0A426YKE0_ENSVE|nr:hypothetical protein B296_00027125 [Ensete ventricosum]
MRSCPRATPPYASATPAGGRSCQWSLLPAAAHAGGSLGCGATPYGLTTGSRPLGPGHERCLRQQVLPLQVPTMPAGGRACWRPPLQGAWPWPATPFLAAFTAKMQ